MRRLMKQEDRKAVLCKPARWVLRTRGKDETEEVTNLELLHKMKLAQSFGKILPVFETLDKYIVRFSEVRWADRVKEKPKRIK